MTACAAAFSLPTARRAGKRHYYFAARSGIFLLWVVIIWSAQLNLLLAMHYTSSSEDHTDRHPSSVANLKSLPRKARTFHDTVSTVHAPPSPSAKSDVHNQKQQQQKLVDDPSGDPDTVYEEDKRIVHTGPNPLHN